MDLRSEKTEKAICGAFLQLREKNSLEKLRVTELCELAEINKTTFYKHYTDIYALNEKLCDEVLDEIWRDYPGKTLLFTDTASFIKGLPRACDARGEIVNTLFADRQYALFVGLEKRINEFYSVSTLPETERIRLDFCIKGLMSILADMRSGRSSASGLDSLADNIACYFEDIPGSKKT